MRGYARESGPTSCSSCNPLPLICCFPPEGPVPMEAKQLLARWPSCKHTRKNTSATYGSALNKKEQKNKLPFVLVVLEGKPKGRHWHFLYGLTRHLRLDPPSRLGIEAIRLHREPRSQAVDPAGGLLKRFGEEKTFGARLARGFFPLLSSECIHSLTDSVASSLAPCPNANLDTPPLSHMSHKQNPVLKWSTQNHASRIKKADLRSYFWLGLSLNLHQSPGFEHVTHMILSN